MRPNPKKKLSKNKNARLKNVENNNRRMFKSASHTKCLTTKSSASDHYAFNHQTRNLEVSWSSLIYQRPLTRWDINTLIRHLEHTFGIVGPALSWIKSYLTNRSQFVRVGANRSAEVFCKYGIPQGSVLGPFHFTLYIAPVANVITSYGVSHLQYADDTQLYIALDKDESIERLQKCADA